MVLKLMAKDVIAFARDFPPSQMLSERLEAICDARIAYSVDKER